MCVRVILELEQPFGWGERIIRALQRSSGFSLFSCVFALWVGSSLISCHQRERKKKRKRISPRRRLLVLLCLRSSSHMSNPCSVFPTRRSCDLLELYIVMYVRGEREGWGIGNGQILLHGVIYRMPLVRQLLFSTLLCMHCMYLHMYINIVLEDDHRCCRVTEITPPGITRGTYIHTYIGMCIQLSTVQYLSTHPVLPGALPVRRRGEHCAT